MRRYWIFCAFFLSAIFLVLPWVSANSTLRVNQAKTKASLSDEQTKIALAIENASPRGINASIRLELLDTLNVVRALSERQENISSGLHIATFDIVLETEDKNDAEALLWYRLRYQIKTATTTLTGIIALAEITPDMFEIRATTPYSAYTGRRYQTRVVALHPATLQPIDGVKITGDIEFDDDDDKSKDNVKATGITNKEGYAVLEFQLPEKPGSSDFTLKITGEYKGLVQEAEEDIGTYDDRQFIINSDKLLYQPGQTLHVRALLLDANRRALADHEVTLKITDEESQVAYRATLKTSRFGITSADWNIPTNIRLGEYEIQFSRDDEEDGRSSHYPIRISRYELPNFTVETKSDRTYYLLNQNAEVEVRGEYLFGQPVMRGHVKVVRETERLWNFREQKWDIEEEDKLEGDLDKEGRFIAKLSLSKASKELEKNNYQDYEDISFTAYLTDITTNRTEQRRFDVRLTKTPILVSWIGSRLQSKDFPLEFYVATFYADGSPAQCQVQLSEVHEEKDGAQAYEKNWGIVKTNRYGLAKIDHIFIKGLNEEHNGAHLKVVARDSKGLFGQTKTDGVFWGKSNVRIKTDKLLYRAGEPITVNIATGKEMSSLFVDVMDLASWQTLFSQNIKLINGHAQINIPYQKNFKSQLQILAYSDPYREVERYDYPGDSRNVIYPDNDELKINLAMSQTQYRPGEEATAEVGVKVQDSGIESALSFAVVDKAVEERTRTDNNHGTDRNSMERYLRRTYRSELIAGISPYTLSQLDLSKPLPEDLRLVAEALLRAGSVYRRSFKGESYTEDYQETFNPIIRLQLFPLINALDVRYKRNADYPKNGAQLRRELNDFGLDFDALRDPWGTPYQDKFFFLKDQQWLQIVSAGIDKKFATADDFVTATVSWKYFKPMGNVVDWALKNHHQRTGEYIRDTKTLKTELQREGVDLATLRDPWGRAYRVEFGILRTKYSVALISSGADRTFKNDADDFTVWISWIDYTTEMQAKLGDVLNAYYGKAKSFPQNDEEFAEALKQENFDKNSLRDGWGKPLYATYKSESRYADRVNIYSYSKYPEQAKQRTEIKPVTQLIKFVTMRSIGPDNKEGTNDDFDVAKFSRVVTEQPVPEGKPELKKIALRELPVLPDGMGGIAGLVTDPAGAIIAGTTITATNKATAIEYQAITNDEGRYTLNHLPAGLYEVKFEATGFSKTIISNVTVTSNNITGINIELNVGTVSEALMVTASAESIQMESASVSSTVTSSQIENLPLNGRSMVQVLKLKPGLNMDGALKSQVTTPRLREYFPETLFWQPEIVTDANGRTHVKFKLADNITTWKLSAIASTTDGRIAVAEREIMAFQPFFAELDPPRILTTGDRLALPVVLRNYLDKPQSIKLQLDNAPWFEMIGAAQIQSNVAAGDARRETFDIRATSPVKDGKQRVTAIGSEASDAIEKTVSVHPDGEEITQTANQIFNATGRLEINIPVDAIKNSTNAELKIYPNLMAHVFESIEAIMQRPYGCAEQTISSAYPSLLALRHCKQTGEDPSLVCLKAQRYMQAGYEKLLNYRNADGGFTYWGRGTADFALTAYALKFLTDANEFLAVDETVIDGARDWLIKFQQSDGRWVVQDWQQLEDKRRSALLTAYVAQIFAARIKKSTSAEAKQDANPEYRQKLIIATKRALDYLSPHVDEFDEPYLIAAYALAAREAGEQAKAEHAIERLRTLVRDENGTSYWSIETNTPFYGWGLAGRVETTALVVRALAVKANLKAKNSESTNNQSDKDAELINRGLAFLLRQKDRFGVWHSTQATVNVLDTLTTILLQREAKQYQSGNQKAAGNQAEIIINGKPAESIALPPASQLTNPLILNVSKYLSSGKNSIEIRRTGEITPATAQIVERHYEDWSSNAAREQSNALRFAVNFDKTQARTGEEILCKVETERIGFRGYGMIMAEIGLPPGADVDRASLELAIQKSNWQINQYDVLPDRVLVYLWPRAGGLQFEFKFRQRFAIEAKNASSVLYDYYNPEAGRVIAPVKFVVE